MSKEALLWGRVKDNKVKCSLCHRRCIISEGRRGYCRVRENRDGRLYTLNFALASSASPDPIEKKPLFHFYPGTNVFSLGTVSCNFRCLHCQNYTISQTPLDEAKEYLVAYSPEKAVALAKDCGCSGIAWTYNEPTIWFEYTLESAKLAKGHGLYTVYVTNGYFTGEALDLIAPYLDAANIDVKGFDKKVYKEVSGAKLQPVLDTVENCARKGIHIELTYLVIPGKNDEKEEFKDFADWVAGISEDIPVHFTRFHPDYKMLGYTPTPIETLEVARETGLKVLNYVYSGNVVGHEGENTYCPSCSEMLIKRWGFTIQHLDLTDEDRCPSCGEKIGIIR